MAEIEGAIVFVYAVNTMLASLFGLEFLLQLYLELSGYLNPTVG
jgi:hypothetical protein